MGGNRKGPKERSTIWVPSSLAPLVRPPWRVVAVVCERCGVTCRDDGRCSVCAAKGMVLLRRVPLDTAVAKVRQLSQETVEAEREALKGSCPQCGSLPDTPCVTLRGSDAGQESMRVHGQRFNEWASSLTVPWRPHWDRYAGVTRAADVKLRRWLRIHKDVLEPQNWVRSDDERDDARA